MGCKFNSCAGYSVSRKPRPLTADDSSLPPAETSPRLTERWQSLVDVLYLVQVTWLYVFSAIYPAVGLCFGVLLLAGSVSAPAKRIGRTCLILGIVNTALVILVCGVALALGLAGALVRGGKD